MINFSCFIVYFLIFPLIFRSFIFYREIALLSISCAVKCMWRNVRRTDVYSKTTGHADTDPVTFRGSRPFQVKSLRDVVWVENHHWARSISLGGKQDNPGATKMYLSTRFYFSIQSWGQWRVSLSLTRPLEGSRCPAQGSPGWRKQTHSDRSS